MLKPFLSFVGRARFYILGLFGLFIAISGVSLLRPQPSPPAPVLPRVVIKASDAEKIEQSLRINGHTQAARSVTLRAGTRGQITKILVSHGQAVMADEKLMQIDLEDRLARLEESKAWVLHREKEVNASKRLKAKAFKSENALSQQVAELETSKAQLANIEREITDTHIQAPFNGIYERQFVEVGDFVNVGDKVATVVELNPLLVICNIPERDTHLIHPDQPVKVSLPHLGKTIEGKIRFMGKSAEPKTRTFRVEVVVDNPDYSIPDGVTAEVVLSKGYIQAHKVSPGFLTLDDEGIFGLKTMREGKVVFYPIQLINAAQDGVWVGGLPDHVDLITVGADFVVTGQAVDGVRAD